MKSNNSIKVIRVSTCDLKNNNCKQDLNKKSNKANSDLPKFNDILEEKLSKFDK